MNRLIKEKSHEIELLRNQISSIQMTHREEKEQLTLNIEYQTRNEIVKSKAIHQHEKITMSSKIDEDSKRIQELTQEKSKLLAQIEEKQKNYEINLTIIANLEVTIQELRQEIEINTKTINVTTSYDNSMNFIRIEKFKN